MTLAVDWALKSNCLSVCVCVFAGECAGHGVGEAPGNPHGPRRPDPRQAGGDGAELGAAQEQGQCHPHFMLHRLHFSATHHSCFIGSTSVPPTIHASSAPLQGNPLDIRFVEFDQLPHLFIGSDCHPFCWFSSQNSQLEKFHSRHGIDL